MFQNVGMDKRVSHSGHRFPREVKSIVNPGGEAMRQDQHDNSRRTETSVGKQRYPNLAAPEKSVKYRKAAVHRIGLDRPQLA